MFLSHSYCHSSLRQDQPRGTELQKLPYSLLLSPRFLGPTTSWLRANSLQNTICKGELLAVHMWCHMKPLSNLPWWFQKCRKIVILEIIVKIVQGFIRIMVPFINQSCTLAICVAYLIPVNGSMYSLTPTTLCLPLNTWPISRSFHKSSFKNSS